MHVTEFLDTFVLSPDIEVIKPLLPDMLWSVMEEAGLRKAAQPLLLYHDASGKSELKRLHYDRRIFLLLFANQQVNVLRHDHVADNNELITHAHPLQHGKEYVATARRSEKRLSPITTTGDENAGPPAP
jgi:hypothetical protein